jgi:hypothetical protein
MQCCRIALAGRDKLHKRRKTLATRCSLYSPASDTIEHMQTSDAQASPALTLHSDALRLICLKLRKVTPATTYLTETQLTACAEFTGCDEP